MRWVPAAAIRPHHCAVIPFIGNTNAKRGFIDTGNDYRDQDHGYISIEAVEAMARMAGWVAPGAGVVAAAEIQRLEAEVADLSEQLVEAERFAEAAEYTLSRFDTRIKNKPGRKAAV